MKASIKWSVVILFWITVFCLSAEGILRYTGKMASWGEKNGKGYQSPYIEQSEHQSWLHLGGVGCDTFVSPEFSHENSFNIEQLRDVDHPLKKPAGNYRIIVLGDSFTEGQGADFSQTWHQQLCSKLNEQLGEVGYEIIAGGVSGSDPVYEYLLLKEKLLKYHPDMVIIAFNYTDILDLVGRGGMERFQADGSHLYKKPPAIDWWYERSHLARFVFIEILTYNWYGFNGRQMAKEKKIAEKLVVQVMDSISDLSKQAGFKLGVVFHPLQAELRINSYLYDTKGLEEELNSQGIFTISLLPYFKQRINAESGDYTDYFWSVDGHHNPRGYALFADAVLQGLEDIEILNVLEKRDSNAVLTTDYNVR